jgi:hypothetical protein
VPTDAVIGFSHGAPDAAFTVPSPTNLHSDRGHQVSKTDPRRQTLQPWYLVTGCSVFAQTLYRIENIMKLNWLRIRFSENRPKIPQSRPLEGVGKLYTETSRAVKDRLKTTQ